jgi:subtilisin family serine protease
MDRMTTLHRPLLLTFLLLLLGACGGGGSTPNGAGEPGPVIVLVEAADDDVDDIAEDTGARVLGPVEGTEFHRVELPAGMDGDEFLALVDDDVRVVDAEEDAPLDNPEGGASTIPAGTAELAASIPIQPELLRIGIQAVTGRADGAGIRVAVVDTGVVASHPALAGRVLAGGFDVVGNDVNPTEELNGVDEDRDGRVDEGFGHGTFVASLVLAVAPEARILPFRVLQTDGFGTPSALATGIARAADAGAHVINVSIGMSQQSQAVKQAVQYARDRGAIVIASVGNSGLEDVAFPSAFSDSFGVTSVGSNDVRATFASFGSGVDLSAPGASLLGAHPGFGSGTARWSGTSFSAAIVSGAVALLRQAFPALTPDDVLERLEDTAVEIDALNPGLGGKLGTGRLDLDAATAP